MQTLCLSIHATYTYFIDWVPITLKKLHEKFQHSPLKILLEVGQSAKNAQLCLIMLLKAFNVVFEKIIFDLQISISRTYPVRIST